MQIKSNVDIFNSSIKRNSRISGLIRAEEGTSGNIVFRSLFDGNIRNTLEEAVGHIETLGINDLRVFNAAGEANLGTRQGLAQVADQARLINERLKNADSVTRTLLGELNLGHLLNPRTEVEMTYARFNHAGRIQNLKNLVGNDLVKNAAGINITDEGATVINYKVGTEMLTSSQAKDLQYALGLGTLSPSFVTKALEGTANFGKLPKRRQSFLSPRDVSIAGDAMKDLTGRTYVYDDVELFFKSIFNPEDVSDIDRYLMSAGLDMSEGRRRTLMSASISDRKGGKQLLKKYSDSLMQNLIDMSPGLTEDDIKIHLKRIYEKSGGTVRGTGVKDGSEGLIKRLEDMIKEGSGATKEERNLALSLRASIDGVEKMRDGEFVSNLNYLKEKKELLRLEKNKLANLPRPKNLDELARLEDLQDIINDIDSMAKTAIGTGKEKSSIARWFFAEGTFAGGITTQGALGKGEAIARDFSELPRQFRGLAALVPVSALKTELGVSESSILFNVAKSSSDIVYMDPLMIAYDPEYMNSPILKQAMRQNVAEKAQIMVDFQKTGILPEEIQKAVFSEIEDELRLSLSEDAKVKDLGIKFSDLTPSAKSTLQSANRREAELITQLLRSGKAPQDIPQLITRINNHIATQAFRMKGDRIDLAIPDTARASLRTYQSSLQSGKGVKLHEKVRVNLSKGGAAADVNFLQFRLEGKRMKLHGAAIQLYHHALGTFDLDDTGVDMMNTFKDANGNDRMAFMIYRQPTGTEEKIFAQADLTDNQTLKTILETKHGNFRDLINDPKARASLSTRETQILSVAEKVMNGDSPDIRALGYSSADIDQVLIKLRKTPMAKDYGFKPLVEILEKDLDKMAVTESASTLGINAKHADLMRSMGLSPGDAPMYNQGHFLNLIKEELDQQQDTKFIDEFNKAMGTTYKTKSEIEAFVNSQKLGSAAHIRAASSVEIAAEAMMVKSLPQDINDTLGLYMNRQASSVSMAKQIDSILAKEFAKEMIDYTLVDGTSFRMPLEDYMKMMYSAAIIPPSEVVDEAINLGKVSVVDQKSLIRRAQKLDNIEKAQAQLLGELESAVGQNIAINEGAAEVALNDIYKRLPEITDEAGVSRRIISLGNAGEHALAQKAKGLGAMRAMQIAGQMAKNGVIDEGSLAGLDPSLVSNVSAYARTKEKDAAKVLDDFIKGMEDIKARVKGDPIKVAAIEQAIEELKHMTTEDALEKIKLREGTAAFDNYAATASSEIFAKQQREILEGIKALTERRTRLEADIKPSPKAQYMEQIESLIQSQKGNLDEIDRIKSLGATEMGEANRTLMYYHQQKVSTAFFEGLSVMTRGNKNSNVLDINDTLRSGLNALYGKSLTKSVLSSDIGIDDNETAMRNFFYDSQSREYSKRALATADKTAVERLQQAFNDIRGGRADISLAEVSQDDAKKYLKLYSRFEQAERSMQPGYDEGIYNFMRYTTGGLTDLLGAQGDAFEAYNVINAQENLSKIEDRYGAGVVDDLLMPDDKIQDATRRIVAPDVLSQGSGSSASNGAYTRAQDFMDSPALRQVFENPTIRRGAIGLAALAVFGFVYSARKDRTSDEMSGPPLLPGGSAYESDMPKYVPSLSNLKYLNPIVAGMQYKINVNGSQKDIEKMQSLTEGVVDGPVNSTMYNSLPRLGKDPYQNVASRF